MFELLKAGVGDWTKMIFEGPFQPNPVKDFSQNEQT